MTNSSKLLKPEEESLHINLGLKCFVQFERQVMIRPHTFSANYFLDKTVWKMADAIFLI